MVGWDFSALPELEKSKVEQGVGMGYGKAPVAMGKHGELASGAKRSLGKRAKGAGRKDYLQSIWTGLSSGLKMGEVMVCLWIVRMLSLSLMSVSVCITIA